MVLEPIVVQVEPLLEQYPVNTFPRRTIFTQYGAEGPLVFVFVES